MTSAEIKHGSDGHHGHSVRKIIHVDMDAF
jgi:hypothetical protein